jgi:xylan 1,4-beta-xylosidase
MAGLMQGDRVKVESTGRVELSAMLKEGVRGAPDTDALATRSDHDVSVLIWNYHDDDLPGPDAKVQLNIAGIPVNTRRVLLRHYRIDQTHSNAYTVWKQLGSPKNPTPEQHGILEAAGQLQQFESPLWIEIEEGAAKLDLLLPRQAVSFVQVSW